MDGHYDLANVDPGYCTLGFAKAPCITVCSLDWGQHASHECSLETMPSFFIHSSVDGHLGCRSFICFVVVDLVLLHSLYDLSFLTRD